MDNKQQGQHSTTEQSGVGPTGVGSTPDQPKPQWPREVQRLQGYFFGHYDSRGGATFIQSDSMHKAVRRYLTDVFMHDEQDMQEGWCWDSAYEDLMALHVDSRGSGPDEIVVFDEPVSDGEVLEEYLGDGSGYHWAWVTPHTQYSANHGSDGHRFLILYKGEEPEIPAERTDLTSTGWTITYDSDHGEGESLGEDAFGLVVML
jgi:hypothetical protein